MLEGFATTLDGLFNFWLSFGPVSRHPAIARQAKACGNLQKVTKDPENHQNRPFLAPDWTPQMTPQIPPNNHPYSGPLFQYQRYPRKVAPDPRKRSKMGVFGVFLRINCQFPEEHRHFGPNSVTDAIWHLGGSKLAFCSKGSRNSFWSKVGVFWGFWGQIMVRNSFWSIMTVFCVSPVLESSGIWKVVTRACSESVHIGNGNPLPRVVRYTKCDGVCFWGIF